MSLTRVPLRALTNSHVVFHTPFPGVTCTARTLVPAPAIRPTIVNYPTSYPYLSVLKSARASSGPVFATILKALPHFLSISAR